MLRYLYEAFPPEMRKAAKKLVARDGHKRHFLDPLRARHLARTKKRMEIIAPKMQRRLALAGITKLEGKRCMEFGCGMVPTELAYYWTLGARNLIAVDYNRIGHFEYMPRVDGFDPAAIDYRAPLDMSKCSIAGVDLIHSESVLEHIAPGEVPAVLRNMKDSLAAGGIMIHSIDLRDHRDPGKAPYAFLSDPSYDPARDFDARGNRLRRSDWIAAFNALEGLRTTFHPEASTPGRTLPPDFDDDRALFLVVVSHRT